MSQPNPYVAPQTPLGAKVPQANVALPREMLVVAAGMKLILWAILVMALAWVAWYLTNRSSKAALEAIPPGAGNLDQVVSIAMRPLYVLGGLMLLSHILNLLGLFQCSRIPAQSGAKGLAQIALLTTVGSIVCTLASFFLQYQALKKLEAPGMIVLYLGGIASVLSVVTLFSFLFFLKKTSLYLGDALAIERSRDLIKRYIAMIVIGFVIAGVFYYASISKMDFQTFGLVILALAVLLLVMAIWTFIIYLRTLNRIRTVVQAGVA